ncbi:MAG: hypothetical protein NAG76_04130 [Candidatus Pristimantibacillus lignocellulolyticus]|uniref:Uncharacterized protein n=1 Tax=Candidatus Pristimantibacillus lignocellulolyticus TaxID=2994561 RepID=A0A9J6ZI13_9BACL|nr:MAG: hypothetical protein NAG76_04130 [Candidatus Pristimantibacillus lignocellulolyticus]
MRDGKFKEHRKEGHHRGGHHRGHERSEHRGAKTFRRGKALTFLEMMNVKRATILQQLAKPEFESINPILVGELKAIDLLINEFTQLFEIHEDETTDITAVNNEETKTSILNNEYAEKETGDEETK